MVLLDIDGTMVDSVPDLAYCIDTMLVQLAMPPRGETAIRRWVGNGLERLVKRALVNALQGEPDEPAYAQAMPIFKSLYSENTSKRSQLYNGVRQGLNYLQDQGYRMGCVTNKAAEFTHPLLHNLDLAKYFETTVCGGDTSKLKPHPQPLLLAAETMRVDPQRSLMIGDSSNDVEAARAAGFQIICTSYGYNHGEDIRRYRPDAVIDSMVELEMLI